MPNAFEWTLAGAGIFPSKSPKLTVMPSLDINSGIVLVVVFFWSFVYERPLFEAVLGSGLPVYKCFSRVFLRG